MLVSWACWLVLIFVRGIQFVGHDRVTVLAQFLVHVLRDDGQLAQAAQPVDDEGDRITVTARLTGNFPGSPVDLRYAFTLEGKEIARLEIAP